MLPMLRADDVPDRMNGIVAKGAQSVDFGAYLPPFGGEPIVAYECNEGLDAVEPLKRCEFGCRGIGRQNV